MLRRLQPNGVVVALISGLLLSFGVVAPHIHFHRAHDAAPGPLEISVHPMGPDSEHAPDHDGHGDDETSNQNGIEWWRTRSHSNSDIPAPEPVAFACNSAISIPATNFAGERPDVSNPTVVEPPYLPSDPRSPPQTLA